MTVIAVNITCRKCRKVESIEVREGYVGSAFDYCTYCDHERSTAEQKTVLDAWRKAT